MKYTEPGTYELTYKAVDECGNETVDTRTVVVEEPTPSNIVFDEDIDSPIVYSQYHPLTQLQNVSASDTLVMKISAPIEMKDTNGNSYVCNEDCTLTGQMIDVQHLFFASMIDGTDNDIPTTPDWKTVMTWCELDILQLNIDADLQFSFSDEYLELNHIEEISISHILVTKE